MATSPAKKQKVSRLPVVFKWPDLVPDVRFRVFDEYEFHVHSLILKLNSAFFRKFLDPANKNGTNGAKNASPLKGFQYEWVSKVNDDGKGWHLVCGTPTESPHIAAPNNLHGSSQIDAFTNLLRALYRECLEIHSSFDLKLLTEMADYYCALKAVSCSLDAAFLKSPYFQDLHQLQHDAINLIPSAAKLRNKILFKDLAVLLAGEWGEGPLRGDSVVEEKYRRIIDGVHDRLCGVIFKRHLEMEHVLLSKDGCERNERIRQMRNFMDDTKAAIGNREWSDYYLPKYYRTLRNGAYGFHELDYDFEDYLGPSLENHLILNPQAVSGEGSYEDWFFSAEVRDSDLPWDVEDSEADW